MIVLGLDLSTKTGWAVFHHDDYPVCGTEKLPKVYDPDDYGRRGWALMQFLERMIAKYGPELVAFESPFIPMRPVKSDDILGKPSFVTTAQTLRLQITLAAVIETTCEKHGIKCVEVSSITAKKELTGDGRAEKRDMVLAATRRGWRVADDHQADACAVALVALLCEGIEVEDGGALQASDTSP